MKSRSPKGAGKNVETELRGVVKRTTGRLTSNPALTQEGDAEMRGKAGNRPAAHRRRDDPDPHRRG